MGTKFIYFLKKWGLRLFIPFLILSAVVFFLFSKRDVSQSSILLGDVKKGNIVVSISESGQVSDEKEIEIQPDASGKVTKVYVSEGDYVKEGQLLLALDSKDALLNISEAEINLEQAKQNLKELSEPADAIDLKKAENSIVEVENKITELGFTYDSNRNDLLQKIEDEQKNNDDKIADNQKEIADNQKEIQRIEDEDLPSAFNSAFSAVTKVFIDLPQIYGETQDMMQGLVNNQQKLFYYSDKLNGDGDAQRKKLQSRFSEAQVAYSVALELYQNTNREDVENFEQLVDLTYDLVSALSDTLKEFDVFLSMVYEEESTDSNMLADRVIVAKNIASINPYLSSVYSEVKNIDALYDSIDHYKELIADLEDEIKNEDYKDSIADLEADLVDLERNYEIDLKSLNLSLEEKKIDLEDLKNLDISSLDVRSQELVIRQKENALSSAKDTYEDYFIYAPTSGYLSEWNVDVGESISPGTIAGKLIDNNKQVILSLNELDILKLDVGQKASLTFDAINDLKAEGIVVEKNLAGTVNSGVVNYEVTLSIKTKDERILSGMSTDVEIVLSSKLNTTIIPKVAVHQDPKGKYVERIKNATDLKPKPFYVTEELESEKVYFEAGDEDDANYEVLSGLEVGDKIILTTVDLNSEAGSTSGFTLPGGGAGPPGGGDFGSGPPSGISSRAGGAFGNNTTPS